MRKPVCIVGQTTDRAPHFPSFRAPLLFSISSVYIYHDPWYIHPPSIRSSPPFFPLIPHLTLCYPTPHSRARVSSVSARVDISDLTFFSLSRPSLRTAWKESYAAEWPLIPRELLRSTFLPPFVRASAALRALSSHLSSAISQRC